VEAILPHHLGIRLTFSRVLGQTRVLNPPAIAVVPRQRGHGLKPVGRDGGHRVERRAEGFRHEFETIQHANGGQHMRGVGTLLPAGLEPTHHPAPLQQLVEQALCGTAGQQPVAEFTEHGKVEARIGQLEAQQVLPVDAGPHRLSGLTVGQMFAELHDRDEGQAPGGEARLATQGEADGKVVILEDRAECITQCQIGIAFGKGGTGNTGSFFRNRLQGVRAQRHDGRPSAGWVEVRQP